jgi:hypothetical protein
LIIILERRERKARGREGKGWENSRNNSCLFRREGKGEEGRWEFSLQSFPNLKGLIR